MKRVRTVEVRRLLTGTVRLITCGCGDTHPFTYFRCSEGDCGAPSNECTPGTVCPNPGILRFTKMALSELGCRAHAMTTHPLGTESPSPAPGCNPEAIKRY